MKKPLNIASIINLAVMGLWVVSLGLSQIVKHDVTAVIFLFAYIASVIAVAAFIITSVIILVFGKNKKFSKPLFFSAFAADVVWGIILAALINYTINIGLNF